MYSPLLRIGRINYLNVWPLFHFLAGDFPDGQAVEYVAGHPEDLNRALADSTIDLSPSSLFEYLRHGERYRLLEDVSISSEGPVLSVHLTSPVPFSELAAYAARPGSTVLLSTASATSVALLKVLWRFFWLLDEPEWLPVPPGQGLATGKPFLEIGDLALRSRIAPPPGYHLIDLAEEWRLHTGLPFVFAVWIARRDLSDHKRDTLRRVTTSLRRIKAALPGELERLSGNAELPGWLGRENFLRYFEAVRYDFGPREQAAAMLFGDYCRKLGLIESVPGLVWER